jgi:hypothetical protein
LLAIIVHVYASVNLKSQSVTAKYLRSALLQPENKMQAFVLLLVANSVGLG